MSQTDPIQALIQDIDEVLQKTTARLPWVMSNENLQQRQVLEQTRAYLADLQLRQEEQSQQEAQSQQDSSQQDSFQQDSFQQGSLEELQGHATAQANSETLLPSGQPAAESAQQVLQSILQEMNYLRVNMLQPMRSDVELLRQQREALTQEIRQLEAQRQHQLQPQGNPQFANSQILMEFLQSAMAQMQENLRGQVVQIVASLSESDQPLLGGSGLADVTGANVTGANLAGTNLAGGTEAIALSPVQRLEQIQRVQSQSDQLLLKLDSTVQVIFESLQGNLQSYQDSLEAGLNRIHNLGQQGEVMVAALVNRLAAQVGREASSYLQAASPGAPSSNRLGAADPAIASPNTDNPNANTATDTQIARLLEELNALDANTSADQSDKNPSANPADAPIDARWQPQPFTLDATPGSLAALSQELQKLDLSVMPIDRHDLDLRDDLEEDDEELTIFQTDFQAQPSSTSLAFNYRGSDRWGNDDERTQFQIGDLSGAAAVPSCEVEDLESALDLLNQLGAVSRAAADAAIAADAAKVAESAESAESNESAEPEMVSSPETLYEDEFYQTLFGDPPDETEENLAISLEPASESPSELPIHASEPEMAFGDLFSGIQEASPSIETSPVSIDDTSSDTSSDASGDASESSPSDPLFEGFGDPAVNPVQAADADFLSDFPSLDPPQDLPQSMENFLLSENSPPKGSEENPEVAIAPGESSAEHADEHPETDLFWDAPASPESPVVQPQASPDGIEVIRTLTELIPSAEATDRSLDLEGLREDAFEREDTFEPAEASENLLALETTEALPIAELEIGEDTLQQLTADLSNLELNSPSDSPPASSDPIPPSSQSSLLLTDLFAEEGDRPSKAAASETAEELLFAENLEPVQLEAASSEQPSAFESEIEANGTDSAFTLEGLDSLFETASGASTETPPAPDSADQFSTSIEDIFGNPADAASSKPESSVSELPAADASPKKKN